METSEAPNCFILCILKTHFEHDTTCENLLILSQIWKTGDLKVRPRISGCFHYHSREAAKWLCFSVLSSCRIVSEEDQILKTSERHMKGNLA